MAVKIRLRRMGAKGLPFTALLWLIPDIRATVALSKR